MIPTTDLSKTKSLPLSLYPRALSRDLNYIDTFKSTALSNILYSTPHVQQLLGLNNSIKLSVSLGKQSSTLIPTLIKLRTKELSVKEAAKINYVEIPSGILEPPADFC